jgi:hypothetical protein
LRIRDHDQTATREATASALRKRPPVPGPAKVWFIEAMSSRVASSPEASLPDPRGVVA